jgi:hypothetical protein
MTYRIAGLPREDFAPYFDMDDAQLAAHGAVRMVATGPGFPCRIALQDAPMGSAVILLNHVSHDVATPYRASYAIFVGQESAQAPAYVDATPPVFAGRPIALRAFTSGGMLHSAALALPGQADAKIRELFADAQIDYIHAHNAAHGCFSARIDRD